MKKYCSLRILQYLRELKALLIYSVQIFNTFNVEGITRGLHPLLAPCCSALSSTVVLSEIVENNPKNTSKTSRFQRNRNFLDEQFLSCFLGFQVVLNPLAFAKMLPKTLQLRAV